MAKQGAQEKEGIPGVHIDYCSGKSADGQGVTILAARERRARMVLATVAPRKGTEGSFAARQVVSFMMELRISTSDVIGKGDHEPGIMALFEDIARH